MAQISNLEEEIELKSSPNRIFDICKNKTNLMPKISPDKLQSIQVLEGDGESVGSVRLWTYIAGGTPVIAKEKIEAMDKENKPITFDAIEGELTKYYKSYKSTLQVFSRDDCTNFATWTLEYEKASEDIPTPHSNIGFIINVMREIDAYLLKN